MKYYTIYRLRNDEVNYLQARSKSEAELLIKCLEKNNEIIEIIGPLVVHNWNATLYI